MKKGILLTALFLLFIMLAQAQNNEKRKALFIGGDAPSFVAQSTNGDIVFPGDFGSSWKILSVNPKSFTPVCSSELLELAYQQDSFDELNAKLLFVVTDLPEMGETWKMLAEEVNYKNRGKAKINFPLIGDQFYKIAYLYGMADPGIIRGQCIRGVFIIDPDNKLRSMFYYPFEVGMNIYELTRTLIALQTNYNNPLVVTPANWQPGEDLMVPVISELEKENIGNPDSDLYQLSWFMTFKKEK